MESRPLLKLTTVDKHQHYCAEDTPLMTQLTRFKLCLLSEGRSKRTHESQVQAVNVSSSRDTSAMQMFHD